MVETRNRHVDQIKPLNNFLYDYVYSTMPRNTQYRVYKRELNRFEVALNFAYSESRGKSYLINIDYLGTYYYSGTKIETLHKICDVINIA